MAWYIGNSGSQTHSVGQKQPNAWGLYDMLGNAWEWVQDWLEGNYYGQSPGTDRRGLPQGSSACCAAVLGSTMPGSSVLPIATTSYQVIVTAGSGFVVSGKRRSDPLILFAFPLNHTRQLAQNGGKSAF